ncbi:MAG: RNA polymerase sigma factor [Sphingomonadales bacterium]|nr:RNA polymerase sigma factor [Sphingomonadales bacterium]
MPPFSVERPPLSVSSGCHNSPVTAFGPSIESELPVGSGIEDAFVSERSRLLRYLERRAGQDAAPDLVQEVFLRAMGSGESRRLANPAAFLQRIARNLLIDRARKRARDNVVVFPFEEERDIARPAEQEWGLEAADLLKLYEAAIDDLPEKTRRVFLMHRVDELSYRDIHRKLGISIATVEYHMIKALAHIARTVDAAR